MPASRNENDFSEATKTQLAKRVNYLCSNPGCRRRTVGPHTDPELSVSIGMAAHITAASVGGPRYDGSLTPEERRSAINGIWTCYSDGHLIDTDADRFPVELLRQWKSDAELEAREALEAPFGPGANAQTISVSLPHPVQAGGPVIVPVSLRGSQLYRQTDHEYLFYVWQLWVENQSSDDLVAEQLRGTLEFLSNGSLVFPSITAEWAISNAADNIGFVGTVETLPELFPTGERAKLLLFQKRTDDAVAYGWSRGAFEYNGRRHPSHQLPPGVYELRVRIRGRRIDEQFRFRVENPGAGAEPIVEGPFVSG